MSGKRRASLIFGLLLLAYPLHAEELKPWRHGVLDFKSDAGFAIIPLQARFAAPQGLAVTIVNVQSDQVGLKALLSGDLDSYEGGAEQRHCRGVARGRCEGHRLCLAASGTGVVRAEGYSLGGGPARQERGDFGAGVDA